MSAPVWCRGSLALSSRQTPREARATVKQARRYGPTLPSPVIDSHRLHEDLQDLAPPLARGFSLHRLAALPLTLH